MVKRHKKVSRFVVRARKDDTFGRARAIELACGKGTCLLELVQRAAVHFRLGSLSFQEALCQGLEICRIVWIWPSAIQPDLQEPD